jgi:hypothetical protein
VLLGALDEGLYVLGFEQFDQLVLSQESLQVLSNRRLTSNKLTECRRDFRLFPG